MIGLECEVNTTLCYSEGSLFIDNSTFVNFAANLYNITISIVSEDDKYPCSNEQVYASSTVIETIRLYGPDNFEQSDLNIDFSTIVEPLVHVFNRK
jgi:hypothetical protein